MAISTRSAVVKIASSYIGAVKGSTKHHKLVDTFNSIKPHGEVGNYKCSWCAIAWSAWQILAGNTSKNVPLSYNCGRLIEDSKKLGIWVEKDSFVPNPGDGIIYAWSDGSNFKSTDRKTGCDHVGIVEKVSGGYIYVIEGNKGNTSAVGRRKVLINGRYIRGFITPKYKAAEGKKPYSGELPTLTQTVKSTAKIGHACANEKGGTRGGKAGDQTTHEVCTGNFKYSSNKASHFHWEYMARAKDANARAEIAKAMKEACTNNNIGYDTSGNDRLTLLKELKENGYKMSKIAKKVECDCSSLVRACCYCAGIKPENFRTGNQLKALKETGKFNIYSSAEYLTSSKHLQVGDILFKPNAHTCVVVSTGTSTTKIVSLKKGDSRTSEVKKLQKFLKWYGFDLSIDGDFGVNTESAVKKFQKNEGLAVDGHFGGKSLEKAKSHKELPTQKTKTAKQIANEKAIQAGIAWAKKIAKNNKYSYKKWTDALMTHRCPICHPGSGNGWNCIGFVSAIFHHGMGVNTVTCSNSGLGNNAFFNKMDEQMFQARNGKSFEKVSKKSKGCIVFCYKDKAHKHYVHTAFYIGDGLIADATSSRGITVRKFSALAKYHKVYYKYTGKGRY